MSIIKDTIHEIRDFNVMINPSTTSADPIDVKRWDRNLNFYFNNQNIIAANETMDQLEIRVFCNPGQANYNYTAAKVEITSKMGKDKETFTLSGSNNAFIYQFTRVIDTTPTPGNLIVEHNAFDTLTATFRNSESPLLPLDSLVRKIPFIMGSAIKHTNSTNNELNFYFKKSSNGKQLLHVNNLPANGEVSIYTLNGKKIFQHSIQKGSHSVKCDIKRLGTGIYYIKLSFGNNSLIQKAVIIK
jgi:hypothetical protein